MVSTDHLSETYGLGVDLSPKDYVIHTGDTHGYLSDDTWWTDSLSGRYPIWKAGLRLTTPPVSLVLQLG